MTKVSIVEGVIGHGDQSHVLRSYEFKDFETALYFMTAYKDESKTSDKYTFAIIELCHEGC